MIRPLALALLVLAACGSSTPPAQSPASTPTASHVEQCGRVAQWLRTTLTSAQVETTLAGSSDIFAQAVARAPSDVDEPQLVDARDRATTLFRSLTQTFATAAAAEKSNDKAGASAAVDQAATQLQAVAAVASTLRDRCPSPTEP